MLWNQASVCGTEGAEGTAGNPGTWTRSRRERRRDYGSDYGSAQPHHTGVYQPTPVESQQPACGVLEQLQHTVSACNYFLFYYFFYQLVLFFVSAHLRWGVSFLPGTHCLLQRVSIVYTRPANNNINNSNCYFYYKKNTENETQNAPNKKHDRV